MNNTLWLKFCLCCIFIVPGKLLFSQKNLSVGVAFTADIISDDYVNSYFIPGAGITYDFRVTKHSGLEGGVFFRNYIESSYFRVAGIPYLVAISERHISVPILYKFYSRIVNIAAGPDFDFYTGWKQRFKTGGAVVNSYSVSKNFFLGIQAKISKQIKLTDKCVLEPEFHFIPIVNTDYRSYIGGSINIRYLIKD
jgi:hypothetical protein